MQVASRAEGEGEGRKARGTRSRHRCWSIFRGAGPGCGGVCVCVCVRLQECEGSAGRLFSVGFVFEPLWPRIRLGTRFQPQPDQGNSPSSADGDSQFREWRRGASTPELRATAPAERGLLSRLHHRAHRPPTRTGGTSTTTATTRHTPPRKREPGGLCIHEALFCDVCRTLLRSTR